MHRPASYSTVGPVDWLPVQSHPLVPATSLGQASWASPVWESLALGWGQTCLSSETMDLAVTTDGQWDLLSS